MSKLIPPDYDTFGNEIPHKDIIDKSFESIIETLLNMAKSAMQNKPNVCYACSKKLESHNVFFNMIEDGTLFCSEECYQKYYETLGSHYFFHIDLESH